MKPCPKCHHPNVQQALFCEDCGEDLDTPQKEPTKGERSFTVGRDADNDVVLDFAMISSHHMRVRVRDREISVEDLETTNGSFLNTPTNRFQGTLKVAPSDVLYLGSYRVSVNRLLLHARGGAPPDVCHSIGEAALTIGRDPESSMSLDHPLISWQHARIFLEAGKPTLEDLGSTNGSFLNGKLVKRAHLYQEDKIMLGPYQLLVTAQGILQKGSREGFSLDLRDLSVVVNPDTSHRKTLLDRISLVIYPGELCGLMGVAGAGKSTLLRAVNGYRLPNVGQVYINNISLYDHYSAFRHSIGYVPQEDIFHKDLTVEQALTYVARLRLNDEHGGAAIDEQVDRVLTRLAMFDANPQIRQTRISDISGGQKRRLNIAIELLTDPSLFFLDEPTSGLSSEDALIVMNLLRSMSEEGRTILLCLHQPSMEIYTKMDNVIYLHKGGRLVYYGPTVPDSLTFTNPELAPRDAQNPEVALRALETETPTWWRKKYRDSDYYKEFVQARQARARPQQTVDKMTGNPTKVSSLKQWWILHARTFNVKLNDTMNSLILLAQSPIIAALIALVFAGPADEAYQSAATTVYLLVISAIWFGCSNAVRDICGEWPIYQRERMFNLKIMPYVLSKFTIGSVISLIQCIILVMIVAPLCHLSAPKGALIFNLWITALAGVALGLFVSAFASPFKKSNEIAVGLIPIVLLPMVIMGGIIKPYKDMNTAAQGLASLMVTRWSFEANLVLEAEHCLGEVVFMLPTGQEQKELERDLILDRFFDEEQARSQSTGIYVITFMCCFCLLATMVYLRRRDLL